jgi:hypothetical protein
MSLNLDGPLQEQLLASGIKNVFTAEEAAVSDLACFNLRITHRPEAVVRATSADDVRAAVQVAASRAIPVTAIGLGHGFARNVDAGIVINTRGLAHAEVDPVQRTARVGAGTPWSVVIDAAAEHGLAPLAGSAPHVGVVGYLLGGGLGPVARTYGFAADHVRSLSVVTGAGELLQVDQDHHPELFWALRGGKHGLGIVTEAVIDLFPVTTLHGGGFFFDGADAAQVLHRFVDWTASLPESVSASVALLRLPPLPELPEPIRGRFVVHVRAAVVDDPANAGSLVDPIRTAATPLMDAFGEMPYAALGMIHADPIDPMPFVEGGMLLREIDHELVDSLLAQAGPATTAPLAAVEIRLLGGAISREPSPPNAAGGRDAGASMHVVGAPVPELLDQVVPAVIEGVFTHLSPWATGTFQANFVGNANRSEDLAKAWAPDVARRLSTVRETYDPRGLFSSTDNAHV